MHLVHQTRVDTGFAQHNRRLRTVGGIQLKALFQQLGGGSPRALSPNFMDRRQRTALFLHGGVAQQLRLSERFREGTADAHHFPGGAHFWLTGQRPGILLNSNTTSFTDGTAG